MASETLNAMLNQTQTSSECGLIFEESLTGLDVVGDWLCWLTELLGRYVGLQYIVLFAVLIVVGWIIRKIFFPK